MPWLVGLTPPTNVVALSTADGGGPLILVIGLPKREGCETLLPSSKAPVTEALAFDSSIVE
jgi:hypothetical protein